jgi:hypothetical protein
MHEFTAQYAGQIAGVLNGFDRLVLRGTLRQIAYSFGLQGYLWANQVLLKDFGPHVQKVSEQVKTSALEGMKAADRPILYLPSSRDNKEEIARDIARQDGIESGPVCALTCVEPCWSFDVHRNRETKQLDLVQRSRKCLFVYQYWQHPELGWMNARIRDQVPLFDSDLPKRAGMAGAKDVPARHRLPEAGQLFCLDRGLGRSTAVIG